MTKKRKHLCAAASALIAFTIFTVCVRCIDTKPIGPAASVVGFSTVNGFVHRLSGVHLSLYVLTDWLSLIPIGYMLGFALLGLFQWVHRKHLLHVDRSLLMLGGFYLLLLAVYLLFEMAVVNHRPVLIDGVLEASYPSSTTVLVLCVMSTAKLQLDARLEHPRIRQRTASAISVFSICMVMGRLCSGVHWLTDIVGGLLLSIGLIQLYRAAIESHDDI